MVYIEYVGVKASEASEGLQLTHGGSGLFVPDIEKGNFHAYMTGMVGWTISGI